MAAQLTFFGTWEAVSTETRVAAFVPAPVPPEPAPRVDPRQGWLFDGPHSFRHEAERACDELDAAALRRTWRAARESYPQWPGARPWPGWADGIEHLIGSLDPASAREQVARAMSLDEDGMAQRFPEMSATLRNRIRRAALSRAAARLLHEEGMTAGLPDGRPAGYLHLLAGMPEEAALALQGQVRAWTEAHGRGVLLGYLGEALWRCGRRKEALVTYRDAYLEVPLAVDEAELSCPPIMDLLDSCAERELPGDRRGWLPVLADLQGRIPLLGSRVPVAAEDFPAGRSAALLSAYRQRHSDGMEDAERIARKRQLLKLAPALKEHLRRI